MAEKKEIVKDIREQIGNFPNVKQVGDYLGMSRNTVKKYLEGVPAYELAGDGKRHYFAIDLAKHLMEMEVAG